MIYLQLNSWVPMWLPVSMRHLFNSLQYIFLVSLHPALLKQMQCFKDIRLFITKSSCNEKNESTVCSTTCTTAISILQRVQRPVLYFSLEYILALPLLPLEEKKIKLHDLIIRSSKKFPKLLKAVLWKLNSCSFLWLLHKTICKPAHLCVALLYFYQCIQFLSVIL